MKASVPFIRRPTTWVTAGGAYVTYAAVCWITSNLLGLRGADAWVLRVALWLVGLIVGGIVLWILAGRAPKGDATATAGVDELDAPLRAAEARLKDAGARSGARGMPLLVVVGPAGSTKTTSVVYSGLEPELLAGEVFHGDGIGPTPGVNVWYTHRTLLVEMGGKLVGAPSRWGRLIRRLRPRTLRATLTGRPQAPRAAVVCYSCEEFLKPGGGEAVPAAARELRTLLLALAEGFGVPLPVYVVFTKADSIPHFPEYAQHLTREESQQVVGATLRWPPRTNVGLYGDREFQRLNAAFEKMLGAVGAKRLDLLAREADEERRGGIYEFPRELRKMVPRVVQFLVDLCRPTQLRGSPILRGVYFTGVRAVVVSDAAPAAPSARGGRSGGGAATQVFDSGALRAAPSAPPSATTRRVPQWLFLGGLFRDVLLADPAPATVARGARQVAALRRVALAAVTGVALLLGLGSTVAFVRNKGAISAARALGTVVASESELPAEETLQRLETLRGHLDRLSRWGRWGLYKGTSLYPDLRRVYRERFDRILLGPARLALLRSLDSLPPTPTVSTQYGRAYSLLKAYLMTTSHPDRLESGFLVPVLMERWLNGRQLDSTRESLARAQFEFYADRLCRGESCGVDSDSRLVARTQRFLASFTGADAIYELVVADAGGQQRPLAFQRQFPAAGALVSDRYEVPPAFSPQGWKALDEALRHVDRFFQADDWVRGTTERQSFDRDQLASQLRRRYVADYIRQWRAFLGNAAVVPFGGPQDAARKLALLSGNQSPLLQLFAFVADNTAVDSATVGAAFQPVHTVVPPGSTGRLIGEGNQPYTGALAALRTVLEQAAAASLGDAQALTAKTMEAAGVARGATQQLANKFRVDSVTGDVGTRVTALLEEPIVRVERMIGRQPASALNDRGAAFCRSFSNLLAKYPFRPNAPEASLAELGAVFEPNNGSLWRFYNEALQNVLSKQGPMYQPKPGGQFTPTPIFVRFFNRLAGVTDALWPVGSTEPRFDFTVKLLPPPGVDTALFNVDGLLRRYTRTNTRAERYTWSGSAAKNVRLSAIARGREVTLLAFDGPWALFKVLQGARWQTIGATSSVQWSQQSVNLEAEVYLGPAWSLVKGDYFTGISCVSQVVQ